MRITAYIIGIDIQGAIENSFLSASAPLEVVEDIGLEGPGVRSHCTTGACVFMGIAYSRWPCCLLSPLFRGWLSLLPALTPKQL